MVKLLTIGGRGYHKTLDAATASFQPLLDRAAIVKRIIVTNVSASDNWVVSIQGQEVARYPVNTTGNQYMLGGGSSQWAKVVDLFSFCKRLLGFELSYPVPQGQTITVASAGGATGDIIFEYEEYSPSDVQPGMLNGQMSNHFIMPCFLVPSTTVALTAAGETDFASQIAAAWLPNLFGAVQIPAAYVITVLAFFLEGGGINTFSGSANHQSTTDHLGVVYQGQRMYTRDGSDGIPIVGSDSAAGSANTVYGYEDTRHPAFQFVADRWWDPDPAPLQLAPGSQAHFYFGTVGDATGNADYHTLLQGLLLDVKFSGMVPQ